jgi:hypothetical protein
LIESRLDGADLTDAKLWETQRAKWSIRGIICARAFWEEDGQKSTDYNNGDFERIFGEKPIVRLRYLGGISPIDLAMLPLMVERMQEIHPNCKLHIHSVQDDGHGAVVTITVDDLGGRTNETFTAEVEAVQVELVDFQNRLRISEETRLRFEAKFEELRDNFSRLIDKVLKLPKYEIHGPVGAIGDHATAHDFKQVWSDNGIDASKLAKQLERLRNAMNRENQRSPEPTKTREVLVVDEARDAISRRDNSTALRCLKKIGTWGLDLAEKIGVDLVVEAVKKASVLP